MLVIMCTLHLTGRLGNRKLYVVKTNLTRPARCPDKSQANDPTTARTHACHVQCPSDALADRCRRTGSKYLVTTFS
jgi:hypothetical protein